jgi:hypothetical protein
MRRLHLIFSGQAFPIKHLSLLLKQLIFAGVHNNITAICSAVSCNRIKIYNSRMMDARKNFSGKYFVYIAKRHEINSVRFLLKQLLYKRLALQYKIDWIGEFITIAVG